ncbi:hypothetical protein D3C75_1368210 [compost metagenome]
MAQWVALLVVATFVNVVIVHNVVGIAVGASISALNVPVDGGWAPFRVAFQT